MPGPEEDVPTGPRDATRTTPRGAAARQAATPTFAAGDVLADRFRLNRFVAQGGMGEVYEAYDLELKEEVALKIIRNDIAGDARTVERFKNEIHLARKVTHPNACRIFDVFHHRPPGAGPDAETVLLSMELLRGETLAERLRRSRRLSPAEALPLVRQMAAALDAAHRAGVIHRDFKSGNVILVPDPSGQDGVRAVVTDFGLARRAAVDEGSSTSLTVTENIAGTPAYMAPEQVAGGAVTAASDIYALGVVLYEMLTGERPFSGDTPVAAMVKRLQEAPPSPRLLVADLDPRWEAVILRCLERDPADRFGSAGDVARALVREPVAAAGGARARRQRLRIRLAGVAALALGLLGLWAFQRGVRPGAPEATAPEAPLPAGVKPRRAVAILGFRNLSGRHEAAWLSTALSEMLGSELAAGEALRIVAGEAVTRMKAELALAEADSLAEDTMARVGRHLGSDLLVLGSYTLLAGRVRFDLRLQNAAAGETIAALTETGSEAELFDLVSRAGARLREMLGTSPLSADESRSVRASMPQDREAARLYSEGLTKLRLFDALAARELLEKAAARDPRHPLIRSALAAAWSALGYEARAAQEAKRAHELSARLSREERLAVEARYRETANEFEQAMELYRALANFFPDNLDYGLRLASVQTEAGKVKEALATFEALRRLPPPAGDDPRIDLSEATASRLSSETKRAVEAAQRAAAKAEALGARRLLARARFEEGSALQNLGEFDKSQAALEEARRLFAEAGDRHGVAGALNNLSLIVANRGDLKRARRLSEEALGHYRGIGNKSGEALMLGNLGNIRYFEGDIAGARTRWEETLVTYREINDKSGIARMLTNIASAIGEQGEVSAARVKFEEALSVWREIGQKSGTASTLGNIGKAFYQEGQLGRADAAYQESLALFREIGDKHYAAGALHDSGDLLLARGDLAGARLRYQEALAMRDGIGEKVAGLVTRLALGELDLEEGRAPEAERVAREAALQFQKGGNADEEASARSLLARALLAQRRVREAREAASSASALAARSQNTSVRVAVALAEARVLAASGAISETDRAARSLRAVLSQRGSLPLALEIEARLALAEILVARDPEAAREGLRSIVDEARAKGFVLLAGKAEAALQKMPATDGARSS